MCLSKLFSVNFYTHQLHNAVFRKCTAGSPSKLFAQISLLNFRCTFLQNLFSSDFSESLSTESLLHLLQNPQRQEVKIRKKMSWISLRRNCHHSLLTIYGAQNFRRFSHLVTKATALFEEVSVKHL